MRSSVGDVYLYGYLDGTAQRIPTLVLTFLPLSPMLIMPRWPQEKVALLDNDGE